MKGQSIQPLRTCIGCRARRGQSEMARLVLVDDEGGLSVKWDFRRRLAGRGAWLCRGSGECLAAALKKKAFNRAFKVSRPLDLKEVETPQVINTAAT
ncbi:DUF448 domain-containing protein [Deltaproteobacteria bacterium Smac51]|nr:DUF448 domain-containing protein [Deltaproteobacteria bacterium Smac51]